MASRPSVARTYAAGGSLSPRSEDDVLAFTTRSRVKEGVFPFGVVLFCVEKMAYREVALGLINA